MTSANVINYRIERNGEVVGEHRQNLMCRTNWHRLIDYTPFAEHNITPYGEDENEAPWTGETTTLLEFFSELEKGRFTIFSIADMWEMIKHIEKQKALLEEWMKVSEEDLPDLKKRTQKAIWYNPL